MIAGTTTIGSTRVMMTSTSYPAAPEDWKGLFIARMQEALAACSALTLEVWQPPGATAAGVSLVARPDDLKWLNELSDAGGIAYLLRKNIPRGIYAAFSLIWRMNRAMRTSKSDLFHVNWLQSALALPNDNRPALITALGTDMQLLKVPFVPLALRFRLKGRKVAICPNAEWMVPILEKVFKGVATVEFLPFGIEDTWFAVARTPPVVHKWLCVSRLTPGKLGPLFEWSAPLFQNGERELHLIGPHQDQDIRIPSWVHFHGPAKPRSLQTDWFPHATGLISLSNHPEGMPQVMLEAMAAGLPIIASDQPAHADLIAHGMTGWICNDANSYSAGLSALEQSDHNFAIGSAAQKAALHRFGTWDDCAKRYIDTYEFLLTGST